MLDDHCLQCGLLLAAIIVGVLHLHCDCDMEIAIWLLQVKERSKYDDDAVALCSMNG